jgi:hypothetical protein
MSAATKPVCQSCWHPAHRADCGVDDCGCVKYLPVDMDARRARQPQWIVQVSFLVRTGWTRETEVRTRAKTASGAAFKGIREAKRAAVRPRARVEQVKVAVIPIKRSSLSGARGVLAKA